MPKCELCGLIKSISKFNKRGYGKGYYVKICKECSENYTKNHWKKNKKRLTKEHKIWQQQTRLITCNNEGKRISIYAKKRVMPKNYECELCHKVKWLIYHHWLIKDKKAYGLWLCKKCHGLAECIEQNLIEEFAKKYMEIKKKITISFNAIL